MVKPLSFKGDPKRKRTGGSSKSSKSARRAGGSTDTSAGVRRPEEDDGDGVHHTTWATPDLADDLEGPVTLLFLHEAVNRKSSALPLSSSSSSMTAIGKAVGSKPTVQQGTLRYDTRIHSQPDDRTGGDEDEGEEAPQIAVTEPSPTLSFVSADAAGSVFALAVTNILGEDRHTSEPDDVRQVWTVFRPGGRSDPRVAFKSSDGLFLSSDESGNLSAKALAAGPNELWELSVFCNADEGRGGGKGDKRAFTTFQLKNRKGLFLGIEWENSLNKLVVKARAKELTFSLPRESAQNWAECVIRMQDRFLRPRQRARKEDPPGTGTKSAQAGREISSYTRLQLEDMAGHRLTDEEVKKLRAAMRAGNYRETLLDLKSKKKHDKFA